MKREKLLKKTRFWTTLMLVLVSFTLVMSLIGIAFTFVAKDPNIPSINIKIIIPVIIAIVLFIGLIQARGNLVKNKIPAIWVYIAYIANQVYGIIVGLLDRQGIEQAKQQVEAVGMSGNMIIISMIVGYSITLLVTLPAIFVLLNLRKLEGMDETGKE